MSILAFLLLIPLITIIAIFFCKDHRQVRWSAAVGMGVQLLWSVYILFSYLSERAAGNTSEVLFETKYVWFKHLNIEYHTGIDGIAVAMVLLTAIVIFAGVFASWDIKKLSKEFFISLILLSTGAFGFFISLDLFTMFFFYELAVIPMYLLIGLWGSGRKEFCAMKLTLMLMGGSALLLVGILGIYFHSDPAGTNYTFDILKISLVHIPIKAQRFLFPLVFVGFGIIGALFPLHSWSPDGHSAAPTAASMLHAGVLMKLGGYGCLKVAVYLMPEAAREMSWIFIILVTAGIVYGAYITILQKDLKFINAFSSVSHCGLVLFGILMFNKTAVTGAVLQMLSHGIMTALFFALIGMIYGRTNTRMIDKMGGLLKVLPFLGTCYIIAGLCSLGLPGLSGFVAEISIFVGAWQVNDLFHRIVTIIAITSILVTAVYILRMIAVFLLGPIKNVDFEKIKDAVWHEKIATGLLLIAIIGIGVAPFWLFEMISQSVDFIIMK